MLFEAAPVTTLLIVVLAVRRFVMMASPIDDGVAAASKLLIDTLLSAPVTLLANVVGAVNGLTAVMPDRSGSDGTGSGVAARSAIAWLIPCGTPAAKSPST